MAKLVLQTRLNSSSYPSDKQTDRQTDRQTDTHRAYSGTVCNVFHRGTVVSVQRKYSTNDYTLFHGATRHAQHVLSLTYSDKIQTNAHTFIFKHIHLRINYHRVF